MAKTEVILTHNIVGLGGESDQVKVAAGYARNYLFPQGFAIPLTGANKRRIEVLKQRRAEPAGDKTAAPETGERKSHAPRGERPQRGPRPPRTGDRPAHGDKSPKT